jgi:hypothetical protein
MTINPHSERDLGLEPIGPGPAQQATNYWLTNKKAYVDSVLGANRNLNWVQRLYQKNTPSIQLPGQPYPSTHFMESGDSRVYPTVVQKGKGLEYLGNKAFDYADQTHTYIQFPDDQKAEWFGKNYKMGSNVLKKFDNGGTLGPGPTGPSQWKINQWMLMQGGDDPTNVTLPTSGLPSYTPIDPLQAAQNRGIISMDKDLGTSAPYTLPFPKDPNYGVIAAMALSGIDSLIPEDKHRKPVVRPITDNPFAYGKEFSGNYEERGETGRWR